MRGFGHVPGNGQWVRDADQRPNPLAVRWWYIVDYDRGDTVFARGGRCATARDARRLIRAAYEEYERERDLVRKLIREHFVLLPDGELRPVPR